MSPAIQQQQAPPPPGADCVPCQGILWPAGQTPSKVAVIFRGLSPCPGQPHPPNQHVFILDQTPVFACSWGIIEDVAFTTWLVRWSASPSNLRLDTYPIGPKQFYQSTRPACSYRHWKNACLCPADAATRGTAIIVPVNNSLSQILAQIHGLDPNTPAWFNSFETAIDHSSCSLQVRPGNTRCKILIDDESVDRGWPLE